MGSGTIFEVDVTISDVDDLYGYEFQLFYNNTVLNVTDMAPHYGTTNETGFVFPKYMVWKHEIDNDPWDSETGYAWLAITLPFGALADDTFDGDGKLATIEFNATGLGTSALTFPMYPMGDAHGTPIVPTVVPGNVVVGGVAGIPEADADGPYIGAVDVPITFNGTGSRDPDGFIESWFWDFGDGNNGTGSMVDHTYNAAGEYPVILTVTDNAGLPDSDATTATIVVDETPPTGTIKIAGGAAYINYTSVTLTLSATDDASGVYQMRFSNDGTTWTSWEAYATSRAWTLTAGDGEKTVYVQFKDKAGNFLDALTIYDKIGVDTVRPTITIDSPGEGSEVKSSSVVVEWSGEDVGSGISRYEVSVDGGTWKSVGTNKTYTVTDLAEGDHTVEVRIFDKAGNFEMDSVNFIVNLSPIGGPGYMEEIALGGVVGVVVVGVAVYFFRFRKKP